MGLYIIIGRVCTKKEIKYLWKQLQNLPNRNRLKYEALHSIPYITINNHYILSVLGADGITHFPVTLQICEWARDIEYDALVRDHFEWYVVEKLVYEEHDIWGASTTNIPLNFTSQDPRHGLVVIHATSF